MGAPIPLMIPLLMMGQRVLPPPPSFGRIPEPESEPVFDPLSNMDPSSPFYPPDPTLPDTDPCDGFDGGESGGGGAGAEF